MSLHREHIHTKQAGTSDVIILEFVFILSVVVLCLSFVARLITSNHEVG